MAGVGASVTLQSVEVHNGARGTVAWTDQARVAATARYRIAHRARVDRALATCALGASAKARAPVAGPAAVCPAGIEARPAAIGARPAASGASAPAASPAAIGARPAAIGAGRNRRRALEDREAAACPAALPEDGEDAEVAAATAPYRIAHRARVDRALATCGLGASAKARAPVAGPAAACPAGIEARPVEAPVVPSSAGPEEPSLEDLPYALRVFRERGVSPSPRTRARIWAAAAVAEELAIGARPAAIGARAGERAM